MVLLFDISGNLLEIKYFINCFGREKVIRPFDLSKNVSTTVVIERNRKLFIVNIMFILRFHEFQNSKSNFAADLYKC